MDIVGTLTEYGGLVIVLAVACIALWKDNRFLRDELIQISKDYHHAIQELNNLIKGDMKDD